VIRRKSFYGVVKSPWVLGIRDAPRDFEPKSTIYDDGEFFISELCDDSYLFFKKIGEGFFAFNNLAGYEKDYILKTKQALIDGDTKGDFLIQRGIEQIRQWEKSLVTVST
jgi:hypothetical protein